MMRRGNGQIARRKLICEYVKRALGYCCSAEFLSDTFHLPLAVQWILRNHMYITHNKIRGGLEANMGTLRSMRFYFL